MAVAFLNVADLAPFAEIPAAKAQAMIDDAMALAARVAPCILEAGFAHEGAARAILRGAVLRWNEAGTGALQTQAVDDYSYTVDNRQQRRGLFWPSEIEQLQNLCKTEGPSGAFSVDTVATPALFGHSEICSLRFGAAYCSCGAELTRHEYPLYELP